MVNKKDNKVIYGVVGFILSILGVLLAFKVRTDNYLFVVFLIMTIIGIVLVAKALND